MAQKVDRKGKPLALRRIVTKCISQDGLSDAMVMRSRISGVVLTNPDPCQTLQPS